MIRNVVFLVVLILIPTAALAGEIVWKCGETKYTLLPEEGCYRIDTGERYVPERRSEKLYDLLKEIEALIDTCVKAAEQCVYELISSNERQPNCVRTNNSLKDEMAVCHRSTDRMKDIFVLRQQITSALPGEKYIKQSDLDRVTKLMKNMPDTLTKSQTTRQVKHRSQIPKASR